MSNGVSETGLNLIPAGYKQTEVGIIPEDWECSNFDYICSTIGDGIHSTPTYNDNGEYFFINGNNLIDGKITTFNETKKTDFAEFYKHKKNLNERTILLSINGTIGNIAFYRDEQIVLGKSAAYLNIKSTIDKYYIYYCLGSEKTLQAFYDGLTGSTIKNLGLGTIRATNIPLPPKKEQTAIANALSDVDALISELEKLIAKKQAIKTATMQQLLTGRTRLPQFALLEDGSKKGTKKSELGEIPEDWEVMRLGHLAKFFKGSGLPKSELSESGKIKCIHYGQLFTTYGPKIDRVISRTENVGIVTSQENDVLMPTSDVTPNGLATASCITETGVTLGGDILIIRSDKQKLNGVFFSYLVNVLRDQVMQLVTGSTVYHLYGSDMAKFEFAFPSKEEQTAIATTLSDMDAEIQALEQRLGKIRQIKQGMMQELLTGKTRLV